MDKVFEEKVSGKNVKDRQALQDMIDYVREGDQVIVHSIDRLARDLRDLLNIVDTMIAKGVSLHFIKENLTFSGNDDPFSKLTLSIAGAFASFDRDIIKSRQAEGIAKAKERGVYQGRKKQIDDNKILELTAAGYSQQGALCGRKRAHAGPLTPAVAGRSSGRRSICGARVCSTA